MFNTVLGLGRLYSYTLDEFSAIVGSGAEGTTDFNDPIYLGTIVCHLPRCSILRLRRLRDLCLVIF